MAQNSQSEKISTGIDGMDEILYGGLIRGQTYLLRGGPGSGKTVVGIQFLIEGIRQGERALYATFEESERSIRKNAMKLGLDLTGCDFLDLSVTSDFFSESKAYDIFAPSEVETGSFTRILMEVVDRIRPERVLVDPLIQFRYLSSDLFHYRKQVASFLRYLTDNNATVVFTSESSPQAPDEDLQFMADGIIELKNSPHRGRSVLVKKARGSEFKSGIHSMTLKSGGIQMFPRLAPEIYEKAFELEPVPSGVPELDELFNGGIERGTVTMITGPSGVGKTTLGLQFMKEAAGRGEYSVVYSFEEEVEIMLRRCDSINIPARKMIAKGFLNIVKLEPLQLTPDEFSCLVRQHVEKSQASILMIDSISGFRLSTPPNEVVSRLHAVLKYCQNMGVAAFVIVETPQVIGDFQITSDGVSYLADNVIFLRYLEFEGELRKAIGILKKRLSNFEKTLREFEISRYGIKVGQPLSNLRGILTGTPEWSKQ